MAWQTDHNDLTTRTWVCRNCNATCLSKSPFQRNTHGVGAGDMTQRMWLSHLQNISCVRKVEAYPKRPREEAMVMWTSSDITERNAPFCFINREHDYAIYLDPGNGHVGDTGKPLQTKADTLRKFFKAIREVTPQTLDAYICAESGGHDWTDDPAEIEARAGKEAEHQDAEEDV